MLITPSPAALDVAAVIGRTLCRDCPLPSPAALAGALDADAVSVAELLGTEESLAGRLVAKAVVVIVAMARVRAMLTRERF